ncbi:hypothetical protein BS47DRAFT_1327600 [Hydnum rufescens UP504]|uniref:Heme haloperoxidase family profile domain-containing protein n=1 Tax=Hydnum rufescens UP504 TaxID=1448309 RepID=A0A9P6DYL6_9AGAM|nr:hypothetical protein BS47DRAFT_1327600 [Hydnum rufescens UP504]
MTIPLFEKLILSFKIVVWSAVKLPPLIISGLLKAPIGLAAFLSLGLWDVSLFLINMFTPPLAKETVVKQGKPGYRGIWPAFVAPDEKNDSRSPCPGLNAMANHGILPHDGRNISMKVLRSALEDTFNFSPSLTRNTTDSLVRLYGRDTIDLGDLCGHNIVEHDASFIRHDAYFQPNQALPARDLIHKLLASASGPATEDHPKGQITPSDLSRFFSLRIAQSKRDNPVFSLSLIHTFFGASNASLLYEALGGDVATCSTVLLEERFPEGFETSMRGRMGFTMLEFHLRSAEIALGITNMKL